MGEVLILTLDKKMQKWLEEKRNLLKFKNIQQVITMLIGVAIERQEEARIHAD